MDTALDTVFPCKAMSCSANVLSDLKHTLKTENRSSVTRYFSFHVIKVFYHPSDGEKRERENPWPYSQNPEHQKG